jgi:hypothetical protein
MNSPLSSHGTDETDGTNASPLMRRISPICPIRPMIVSRTACAKGVAAAVPAAVRCALRNGFPKSLSAAERHPRSASAGYQGNP